jgi:hypothetical protein
VTTSPPLVLRALRGHFVVCRLDADEAVPEECLRAWQAPGTSLVSVTRTASELSIVCPVDMAPAGARVEGPWQAFAVEGTLDFAMVGVLVRLTTPLAAAGISVFAISTFDTDYLLVPAGRSDAAMRAWEEAGERTEERKNGRTEERKNEKAHPRVRLRRRAIRTHEPVTGRFPS